MDEKLDQTHKLVLKCINKISYILYNNKGGILQPLGQTFFETSESADHLHAYQNHETDPL